MGQFAGFKSVKLKKPQRSEFDLTHDKRLSMRMGNLVPVVCVECVPSDTFRGSSEILLRLAPMLAPIYDQIELYVHYYFVPNRLLWDEWETFITGGRLGVGTDPVAAPVPPYFKLLAIVDDPGLKYTGPSSLADYLGHPDWLALDSTPGVWNDVESDLMPFLAYQLIWMEYYRDRNFVADDFMEFPVPSGEMTLPDANRYFELRIRSYEQDYFTSALPFTQRGEEVLLPVDVAVTYLDVSLVKEFDGSVPTGETLLGNATATGGQLVTGKTDAASGGVTGRIENIDEISNASTTINDFRTAYALQVWLERNAIGGSRYTESTQAHFGVQPQDSRLQRPEYIGGGRIPVKISEVLSTSWSSDGEATVPLANMGGHGVTYGNTNQFRYFCTEHGFIVGICSIMNKASYQQGLPRMFRRRSFLDYPWPTFAKLGEQQVYDYEIYATPAALTPDVETGEYPGFGYQSRYADWKYICSSNQGDFKTSLLFWTLTRVFDTAPTLGFQFNYFDRTTQDRIFAVPGTPEAPIDNFWLYCHNKISVRRPLPYFGTPNTLGFGS